MPCTGEGKLPHQIGDWLTVWTRTSREIEWDNAPASAPDLLNRRDLYV
jgi:hypothetical protein